jgi:Ulp1 family protease
MELSVPCLRNNEKVQYATEFEITATSNYLKKKIIIYDSNRDNTVYGSDIQDLSPLHLSYHRGVHYNALHQVSAQLIDLINSGDEPSEQMKQIREQIILETDDNITLLQGDLQRLKFGGLLNDSVIQWYLNSLKAKFPKCFFFHTYFFTREKEKFLYDALRCFRKVDLFSYSRLFIPIHISNIHWVTGAIDLDQKTIGYYDSLRGATFDKDRQNFVDLMKEFLEKKAEQEKVKFSPDQFQVINTPSPEQKGGVDCGVFVLKTIELLSQERPLQFTQDDIPQYRQDIIDLIANLIEHTKKQGLSFSFFLFFFLFFSFFLFSFFFFFFSFFSHIS